MESDRLEHVTTSLRPWRAATARRWTGQEGRCVVGRHGATVAGALGDLG